MDETTPDKIKRAAYGAFYGLLIGATFVFVAAFIDLWLNPDLPLGVNWSAFAMRLPLLGLGLAVVGAISCWWQERLPGLLSGAAVAGLFSLIAALTTSRAEMSAKLAILVFAFLPVAAMNLPVAWILRRLVERHAAALQKQESSIQIARLLLVALALGAGFGYFMKMPARGLAATQFIYGFLQNPSQANNPISEVEGMQSHTGGPYKLYTARSKSSTEGFDIHAEYEDGFVVRCTVIVYPGQKPYISTCTADQ